MAAGLLASFGLGLATPLTAACVLPLYPGFIAYLTRQLDADADRRTYALFGGVVVAGVLSFMLSLGLVFSFLLQESLTQVIGVVSPVAFGILAAAGAVMLVRPDLLARSGGIDVPEFEDPLLNAFGFGFFFGAIIVPCNPAFIAVFFARAFLLESPLMSLLNFGAFGLGIGAPLLAFTVVSSGWRRQVIDLLTGHEDLVMRGSGGIMLVVALYYLIAVFNVIGTV